MLAGDLTLIKYQWLSEAVDKGPSSPLSHQQGVLNS